MKNYLKYIPTLTNIYMGLFLILIGIMLRYGGSFSIQIGEQNPIPVPIPTLTDTWIAWLVVWLGIDTMIFRGRATPFIIQKTIVPVIRYILESTIGKERLQKLEQRICKKSNLPKPLAEPMDKEN